jgi:hypothetical protein
VDLEDSALVKSTAQNMVLYNASITERTTVLTTWEIQVYKKRKQMENTSLYERDYLEDARLCGTDHLKPTTLYGRDHLGDTNTQHTTWNTCGTDHLTSTTLYGRDHLGDTNIKETTWETQADMEQTDLEMAVNMETTWERQR